MFALKSMFLWKQILTFTGIDYSFVKRQEKEECFALWEVKQLRKLKGGGVKNQTEVCVGGEQKMVHTIICGRACIYKKENEKTTAILLLAWKWGFSPLFLQI